MIKSGEYVLYGIANRDRVIKEIVDNLNAKHIEFDIRLILTEALVNAYIHGNKKKDELPIFLKYCYDGICVTFKIEDCGEGCNPTNLESQPVLECCLQEHGRGITLIKCYSDNLEFKGNKLTIEKYLTR